MRNVPPLVARRFTRAVLLIWFGLYFGAWPGAAHANAHEHVVIEAVLCASICRQATIRVWDGDTVRIGFGRTSERVRLASIDAPEIEGQCKAEIELALQSRHRLADLLRGNTVTMVRHRSDRYGRTLAALYVDGVDVGEILAREGLARVWSGRREPWC